MTGWFERAGNLFHALRRRRRDDARMRSSRDELAHYRQVQLDALVRHAAAHAPFYRRLYGVLPDRIELAQLPVVTKSALMTSYDDAVTDKRLRLDRLHPHLAAIRGDDLFAGELRVMTSSGSSGQKAIFAYDRGAWRDGFLVGSLRMTRLAGLRPRLGRRLRVATVAAPDGKHMTFRGGASMDVGMFHTRRIAATLPIASIVAALQEHQPAFIIGYPSMLALLAEEQRAGRLHVSPTAIVTSSEMRTPATTALIREVFGVAPFDCLGLTETGIAAMDCDAHAGLHVFEDLCIIENVDADNRPVSPGSPGAKILVTNLFNRTQPIIRFEVSDLVTMTDAPCACGITFQRITALDGRSDDLLEIAGRHVHPIRIRGVLGGEPRVLQYQVTQYADRVEVEAVLAACAVDEVVATLAAQLRAMLQCPVVVRAVPALAREDGAGKLKLVRRAHV